MDKKNSEKIEDLLNTLHPEKAHLNDFIKASEEYERLIQEGLTKKRGFNIMTTEEILNPVSNFTYSQTAQKLKS